MYLLQPPSDMSAGSKVMRVYTISGASIDRHSVKMTKQVEMRFKHSANARLARLQVVVYLRIGRILRLEFCEEEKQANRFVRTELVVRTTKSLRPPD